MDRAEFFIGSSVRFSQNRLSANDQSFKAESP